VLGGAVHGDAGIRDYFREFTDTFESIPIEIERTVERGNLLVGRAQVHGRA
jgi:hypothetical protein